MRLWDHAPLLLTFAQLQEIRTYYRFVDVDNDRYVVDGEYRQVMLSARELSYQNLPRDVQGRDADLLWINEHLQYTHGYGAVVGPVNRITTEGLPELYVKDIPPASDQGLAPHHPAGDLLRRGVERIRVRPDALPGDRLSRPATRTSTRPTRGRAGSRWAPSGGGSCSRSGSAPTGSS